MDIHLPFKYEKHCKCKNNSGAIDPCKSCKMIGSLYDNIMLQMDKNPLLDKSTKSIWRCYSDLISYPECRGVAYTEIIVSVDNLSKLRSHFDLVYSIKPYKPTEVRLYPSSQITIPIENFCNIDSPYIPSMSVFSNFELTNTTDLQVKGIYYQPRAIHEIHGYFKENVSFNNKPHVSFLYQAGSLLVNKLT
jgi:hypothetical protein